MTVSQELKEWASKGARLDGSLSAEAVQALLWQKAVHGESLSYISATERRTFALLVAEALEN